MWLINLFLLSWKQLRRNYIKTLLTVVGTAAGMFLFLAVAAMQEALQQATEIRANDDTLVVYRDKRFCPFTSRLPLDYYRKIAQLPKVKQVTPLKIVVNHCGTSLDTVCFRGIPKDVAKEFLEDVEIQQGDFSGWLHSSDGAFLGETLALRRGLSVGDKFDAAGITVRVAGIIASKNPQNQNVAYVHLDFLQQASGHGLGVVTQFNVKVHSHKDLAEVAKEIDALFRNDREPTHTRPEKAFVAQIAKDMVDLIAFTYWLGLAAVFAVLALITNTIIIAVRGRVRENAVLRSLGFRGEHLTWLTLCEGLLYSLWGGGLGIITVFLTLYWGHFSISGEGVSIVITAPTRLYLQAVGIALSLGLIAGIYPAILASRGTVAESLRRG